MLAIEYTHSHQSQGILFPSPLRLAARPGVVQEPPGLDDRPLAGLHAAVDGIGRPLGDVPQPDRLDLLGQHLLDVLDDQHVAVLDPVIVGRVGEGQRHDPEIDEVVQVDPLDALGDDGADAQVHGAQGGMLPRGALPVAQAGHDGRGEPLLLVRRALLGKLGVHVLEDEGAVLGDIGAVLVDRARRGDVVRGDLVAHLDGDPGLELGRHRGVGRRGADVRAAAHLLFRPWA